MIFTLDYRESRPKKRKLWCKIFIVTFFIVIRRKNPNKAFISPVIMPIIMIMTMTMTMTMSMTMTMTMTMSMTMTMTMTMTSDCPE